MSGTSADRDGSPVRRLLDASGAALAGWGFAVTSVVALLTAGAATLAMLAWPSGSGPVAEFAAEFRRWCFGREEAGLDLGLLALAISSPIVLSALVAWLWWEPLREGARDVPGRLVAVGGATAAAVLLTGLALFATQRGPVRAGADGRLPFPGADIRTSVPAPDVELVDHLGRTVRLADLRGRVVVVTSVYARCNTACPMILAESHALMASLPPSALPDVTLLAITLDPSHDTTERLAEVARGWSIGGDVHLLSGEPARVERALDLFGFERRRDPATGRIDHAGFFVVIDRDGLIAWRLAASSAQGHWLPEAVLELVGERFEPPPAAAALAG
jgi:protein SCO1/2